MIGQLKFSCHEPTATETKTTMPAKITTQAPTEPATTIKNVTTSKISRAYWWLAKIKSVLNQDMTQQQCEYMADEEKTWTVHNTNKYYRRVKVTNLM